MEKLDTYEPRRGDVLMFVPKGDRGTQPATFQVVDDTGRLLAPAFKDGKRYPPLDGWASISELGQGTLYLATSHGLVELPQ